MADLVGHDRAPSAFLTYLILWKHTRGGRGATTKMSLRDLAEESGLSKRAVQIAIRHLTSRRLISSSRASPTATPEYAVLRPWRARR
jgi:Helix-turn-helix domain